MKLYIDGHEVVVNNALNIEYETHDKQGNDVVLKICATHEGLIYDVYESSGHEVMATQAAMADDIVEFILED